MKILFMGTPQFAVPTLEALIQSDHEVLAVFCQPDRPKGRSKQPQPCPVKQTAVEAGIQVLQPERIRRRIWRERIEAFQADVCVVVAYGQILSKKIIAAPRVACVNLHASLLPRWRGASPIHHAILSGDAETGVTLMQLEMELDAGPVFSVVRTTIGEQETRPELESRLANLGAEMLLEQLPQLETIQPNPQPQFGVTYAPIIQKQDGRLSFTKTAKEADRMVRAFGDWPGVTCQFKNHVVKFLRVQPVKPERIDALLGHDSAPTQPGSIVTHGKKELFVVMADRTLLQIEELQPSGKKPQNAQAFLNGYKPSKDDLFQACD